MAFWTSKKKHNEVKENLNSVFPRLWRYCFILSGSNARADDLAQSTCVRALEKAEQFTQGTQLDRWLFRIAKNTWLNELRSEAVRDLGGMAAIDEMDILDQGPGPQSSVINKELLLGVMSLPEAQRVVVGLVYIEGYSYAEAAELLDIPVGTIMSRLSAARLKLAKKFKHYQRNAV